MKRQLLGVAAILLSISTYAQDNPLWMRYCAISPDGTTIAFTYKGDIYTVPSTGGRASQITTNPAHDTKPIWSPDGKKIAFASDRMGSMDIFEVNKEGGIPKRLTTHSGNETPVAYKDAGHILFLANIMPTVEDAQFPSGQFQQVYEVNTEGGRPALFSSMPMEDISINHTGNTLLYHDKKGYEDPWRKHHTSSITRDIWLCSLNGNRTFRKQTTFNGEDRTPVWASDDKSFYYLSEEKGSFNIFKRDIDGNTSKQITNHTKHPVRFLSAASNGTLCYGYDGEIYTVKEGAIPQKVQISIVTDKNDKDLIRQIKRSGATEISLSPDAKEIAFVLRGDVYVTSTEYSTTKQITNTPQQERDIHFSPDGRSIVYASERNGLWQIYQTSLAKKEEKQFAYATDIKEERLTNSDITSFQPQYSPDGKEVAFLENRTTIRVLNLKSKAVRTVMDGNYEYSYSDGDQWYQWSPDSKWILTNYIGIGGWNNKDVALVNASGNGEIHNLTESGYSDGNAKWVLDGKAMIWESDRAGFRSHGSWGAEADIYIMFFDLDAYDRFRMSKEELALLEESEKKDKEKSEEKKKADNKKDKKKDSKKEDDKKEVKPLVFDLENSRDRVIRLTVNSSRLGDAVLTPKGDKLYYQAAFESGYDLWEHDLKENKTKIVMKKVGGGALLPDKKGENLFLCSQGGIKKVTVSSGETKPVEFEAFFDYQPYGEREYIFDHVWQQVEDKFYVKDLHGVDWKAIKTKYAALLPYAKTRLDLNYIIGEMIAELACGHAYVNPGEIKGPERIKMGLLGAELNRDKSGFYRIEKILPGAIYSQKLRSPLTEPGLGVKEGDYITAVDGIPTTTVDNIYSLLIGKAGVLTELSINSTPSAKGARQVVVNPIDNEYPLYHYNWVQNNIKKVEEATNGRVGYVYIPDMGPDGLNEFARYFYPQLDKEALIIDDRANGGGNVSPMIIERLLRRPYRLTMSRTSTKVGTIPDATLVGPKVLLINKYSASDGDLFPWSFKANKIGKVIGTRTWGGIVGISGPLPYMDDTDVRVPFFTNFDAKTGQWIVENHGVDPDILIDNDPIKEQMGEDQQLRSLCKS